MTPTTAVIHGSSPTLTIDEASHLLGCKRTRVFELLRLGTLERAPRFGRSLRILRESVERALEPVAAKSRAPRRRRFKRMAKADYAHLLGEATP